MGLIILERQGILVLAGTVTDATPACITLCGQANPSTEYTVRMRTKKEYGWIKKGSRIMAVTSSHPTLSAIYEGAKAAQTSFEVWLHAARFTGSFDFAERGTEKEEHVFCGSVLDLKGRELILAYTAKGEQVTKRLFLPESLQGFKKYDRHIFVTGAPINNIYPVLKAG